MGDLIVTCTSMHSRNRRAGILIGQGKTPREAMEEVGAVVEGYFAAESIHQLSERVGVEMPISAVPTKSSIRQADPGRGSRADDPGQEG